MKKVELPSTLEWYRDTGKWILGLALGGLSGFIGVSGFSERLAASNFWLKLLFAFGGIAVLLAVIFGVLFVLFLAQFGNALEKENELSEDTKMSESKRTQRTEEINQRKNSARRGVGPCYWILLVSFFLSLFAFGTVACWLLFAGSNSETKIVWSADGDKLTGALQPLNPTDSNRKVKDLVQLVDAMNSNYAKHKSEAEKPVPTCSCTPSAPVIVNVSPCCPTQQQTTMECPNCRKKKH